MVKGIYWGFAEAYSGSGMDFMVCITEDSSEDLLVILGAEGPIRGSVRSIETS